MKKIVLLFLLFGLAAAAFAQNYNEVEQQINRAVQSNQTEYDRLQSLLESTTDARQLESLVNAFNRRQNQIGALQKEIEDLINRPAAKQVIDHNFGKLEDLMKAQQRLLDRLNSLKN